LSTIGICDRETLDRAIEQGFQSAVQFEMVRVDTNEVSQSEVVVLGRK